jgi:hypothetical protein
MRAAISSAGFPSDTHLLVDACIARVRAAACLDDDAVLPPLPTVAPRREVVVFTKSETGVAAATPIIVEAPRPVPRRRRWPIFLCAFVAGIAGGAAFVASPAGQRPEVLRATHSARMHAESATHAAMSLISSLR